MADTQYIEANRRRCAYVHSPGSSPGIFFLGGFNSSMQGLKAIEVEDYCREKGFGSTRFDYSGHGQSSGEFADGCVGDWLADALAVFDKIAETPQILIGSSMGAWIGTLLALQRPEKICGFVGIASALDFTRDLVTKHLDDRQRSELRMRGRTHLPSCYDDGTAYTITQKLIEDGNAHLLLDKKISFAAPVHLLHGMDDSDIRWQTSVRFALLLDSQQVELTLIGGGDHRLSSQRYLKTLRRSIDGVYARALRQLTWA